MHTIQSRHRTGADGTLTLTIPLDQPNAEFEVLVVVQPQPGVAMTPDPWAGSKAIFARLAAGGRTFSDSVDMIREDRER